MTLPRPARSWQRTAVVWASIYFAYLLTGLAGLYLYSGAVTIAPAVIWIPFGVAIAAVIIEGYWALFPIALAAASIGYLNNGFVPAMMGLLVVNNTLQPLVALFFLRLFKFNMNLSDIRDVALLLSAGTFATMIAPTGRAAYAFFSNTYYGTTMPIMWGTWWLGGMLSVLVLVPLILMIYTRPKEFWNFNILRKWEFSVSMTLLALTTAFLFEAPFNTVGGISLIFPLLLVLMWIALRSGVVGTGIALFMMTSLSLASALFGTYEMPEGDLEQRLFNIQVFDLLLVFVYFIIASLEEQRKTAIDELKLYAGQLEISIKKLRRQEVAKNEFIVVLAHELRNPLALLDNSAQLIKLEFERNKEGLRLTELVMSRIRTMARLLDDLLDISRITQRRFVLQKEVINMQELVKRTVESIRTTIQNRGHTFRTTIPQNEMMMVVGDEARIEQIVLNLLINAAKYTPERGLIELTLAREDGWIVIRVKDNGVGIPVHLLDQVFEPFMQINRPFKLVGTAASLGVGLSVTKQLVELHGGTVTARSAGPDTGSEFVVHLPANVQHTPPSRNVTELDVRVRSLDALKNASDDDGGGGKNLSILVVDDEEAIADGFKKLLEKTGGHSVSVAYTGQDAVDKVRAIRPQVVILDIGLPDINGYEVARRIKSMGDGPYLIAMSGYGQKEDKDRAKAAGFNEHLTKPAGISVVQRILNNIPS